MLRRLDEQTRSRGKFVIASMQILKAHFSALCNVHVHKSHRKEKNSHSYLRRAEIGLSHYFSIVNMTRIFFLAVASSAKLGSRKSTFQQCHYSYGCLNTGCVKLDLSNRRSEKKWNL